MAITLSFDRLLPVSVRVNDLKPGQVGLQVDNDVLWMRVNDRLLFAPRSSSESWQLAPRNNTRVYVNLLPMGTEIKFKSAA